MRWIASVGVLAALALVAVQAGPASTARPTPRSAGECVPGTVWRQACNSCRCTDTGVGICDQLACLNDDQPTIGLPQPLPMPDHTRPAGHRCREGHVWKQDCNTCRCSNGRAACTLMACLSLGASGASALPGAPGANEPSLLPAPAPLAQEGPASHLPGNLGGNDCTPGDTWRNDCNTCRCLPSGQAACTMARCVTKREVSAQSERRPCIAGEVWKADCNTCHCGPTGEAACTKIRCIKPEELQPSGQRVAKREVPAQSERRPCIVGEVWKADCNTCHCGPTGEAACTKIRCIKPEELQPSGQRVARDAQNSQLPAQEQSGTGQVGCVSGTSWAQDCNQCTCMNGRPACTLALCIGSQQRQQ